MKLCSEAGKGRKNLQIKISFFFCSIIFNRCSNGESPVLGFNLGRLTPYILLPQRSESHFSFIHTDSVNYISLHQELILCH